MSWSACFPVSQSVSQPRHLDDTRASLSKASTIITSRLVPQQLRCLVAPRSRIILQQRVLLQLLPPPQKKKKKKYRFRLVQQHSLEALRAAFTAPFKLVFTFLKLAL